MRRNPRPGDAAIPQRPQRGGFQQASYCFCHLLPFVAENVLQMLYFPRSKLQTSFCLVIIFDNLLFFFCTFFAHLPSQLVLCSPPPLYLNTVSRRMCDLVTVTKTRLKAVSHGPTCLPPPEPPPPPAPAPAGPDRQPVGVADAATLTEAEAARQGPADPTPELGKKQKKNKEQECE